MSLNTEVTALVAALKHPMTKEIAALRKLILASHKGLRRPSNGTARTSRWAPKTASPCASR